VLRALRKLGLKPDPTADEVLAARESGKPPPCGDAARENAFFLQISSAVYERRILTRFERKPRPKDVAAELWTLAKVCRSSARTLRGLSKRGWSSICNDLDFADRFARAERFEDPPESFSRLRMLQAAGVEQELAASFASLASESAYLGVTQDEHLLWLEGDKRHPPAGVDKPLMAFAREQEKLCAVWGGLSELDAERSSPMAWGPAMEQLFGAQPLWALSRPAETFEANPAFWRALGPPPGAACQDVELIRRWLLEKLLAIAKHADGRRREFEAAWPLKKDKGGVSPLVGSANSRLGDACLRVLGDALGTESYDYISSFPGGAYNQLLLALDAMANEPKRVADAFNNARDTLGEERYDRILREALRYTYAQLQAAVGDRGDPGGAYSQLLLAVDAMAVEPKRVAAALMNARDTLGEKDYVRILRESGHETYVRMLQACKAAVAGEKTKVMAFKDHLDGIPAKRDELLNRPGPKARREQIAEQERERFERQKSVRERAETDSLLKRMLEADEFGKRRLLWSVSARDQGTAILLRMRLAKEAEQPKSTTWVPSLAPIKRD